MGISLFNIKDAVTHRTTHLLHRLFTTSVQTTQQLTSEADPFNNRISNESPVGKAILGKRKGDEVEVSTPDGPVTFKVLAIQ